MNAAGFSPIRLFRSVIFATGLVAIFVALIAAYLAPDGMRRLQRWEGEVSSDLVANLLQPGRFAQIDQNLTTLFKERQPDGLLIGVFIDERSQCARHNLG
jgi:lipopolysaccharide export system permease protein